MKMFWLKFVLINILCLIGFVLMDYALPGLGTQKSVALGLSIECFAGYIVALWKLIYENEE